MANSPAHQFGQIVGDVLEAAVLPVLEGVARRHGLYLDRKCPRNARGGKREVVWKDAQGNNHKLDFVIEAGGSEMVVGAPRAFIETAWRRYTKHSKNKAQEIQGAIGPIALRYAASRPFLGVVLAGEFTESSIQQLRSHGFTVLYFSYLSIVRAFAVVGIDAASREQTPDADFAEKVGRYVALRAEQRESLYAALRAQHVDEIAAFEQALDRTLARRVVRVAILPLHGQLVILSSASDAISMVEDYGPASGELPFVNFEIRIQFSNGDQAEGRFAEKKDAVHFLQSVAATV